MLVEVERLDVDDLPDALPSVLRALAWAARTSETDSRGDAAEDAAMRDERARFARAVVGWTSADEVVVEPLAYRRTLSAEEGERWRALLLERWGPSVAGWMPLEFDDVVPGVLVVSTQTAWDDEWVDGLRALLRARGVERVFELREWGADREIEVAALVPSYTGAEGMWTDGGLDWVIYASHEGTAAYGGWLAEALEPVAGPWR
ncbi:hypothetical protein AB0A74_40960 [Saccharothrix sp. NPDC042600]|uniref:hypothetical protein n=1 Tax=Saccharothrix TaxID=2071 RepID=UPI0033C151F4